MVQTAAFRPLPIARVVGDGTLSFPSAQGLGNFRGPPIQISINSGSFSDQVAREAPANFALRDNTITLFRGGNIDLTA